MLSFQSSKISPLKSMEHIFESSIKDIDISFEYPDPSGLLELREKIKELHSHWSGEVLITNSATEATYLSLSEIRGGVLALNVPSYFGIIRQIKDLGITVIEWETVDELLAIEKCDAILLTSNITPPTGESFTDLDKSLIGSFADSKNAIVIEDNAYEFLAYGNKPLTSITANKTIRINSFSKVLSPNLRMGFLMSEGQLLSSIRSKKITMNLSSSPISQSIISSILKDENIITGWQNELNERAMVAQNEIYNQLGVEIKINDGGCFLKLPIETDKNINDFIDDLKKNGLLVDNNKNQYIDNESKNYLRLHLGAIKKKDIEKAISIIKNLL